MPVLEKEINTATNCLATMNGGHGEPLLERDGEGGLDLVRTVVDFTRQISDLYKQHANSLQNIVHIFRHSNDKMKDRLKERTSLLRCWDAMLEEYQAAVQNNFDIANSLFLYVAEPLSDIVSERQKLVTQVKGYHDELQDETEEMNSALLKSQRNYAETWMRMTKAQSQGSIKNPYLSDCYNQHNSYVLQLSLVNAYNASLQELTVPHIIQDLQSIQASVVESTAHAIIKHAKIIQTRLCDQGKRMDAIVTLTRAVDAKENIGDMQFPSNKPKTSQYMFTKPEASVTGDFSQGKLIHHPSTEQSLQMTQGQLMKEIDDLENELSDLNDKLNKQKRYCESSNSRRGSNVIKRSSEYQTDVYKVRNEMRKIEMIIKTKQSQLELFSSEGVAIKSVNGIQKNDYIRKSSNHISKMQNDLIRKEFEVTCKEVEDFTNREPDYLRDDFKHIKRENGRSKREPEQMRNEVNDVKKDGINGQTIDYGVRRNSVGVRKEKEKKEKEVEIKKSEKDAENRKTDKDESMKKEESTEDQSSSQSKSSFERALLESKDAVAELLEKGGRQHVFQDYNFKKPTFCDQCRGLLRGLIKQGLRCKLCKVSIHHKCQQSVPACRGAPQERRQKFKLFRKHSSLSEVETDVEKKSWSEKRKLLRRQKSSSEVEGPRDETPRIEIDPVYEAIKSASRMSVRNHQSEGSSSSRRKSSSSPTSPNHRHTTSSPGELLDYSNADSSSRDSLSPGRSGGATPKSAPHSPASSRRKLLKSYGKSMSLDAEPHAAARGGSCYGYRPRRQQSEIEQLEESDSESYIRSSPIGQVVSGSFRDLKNERDGGSSSLSTGRYDGSNRTLSKSPSNSTNVSSKDLMSSSQPVARECIALYNFEGSVPEDLTFSAGDKVYLLDSSSSEWWKGELDNKVGFFPAFCVEPIQRWERALRVTRSHKGSLEQPDGLNLRRDQIVIQMSNVESGWVTVRMGKGQRGSYPYCYLAPIHHKYFQWGDEIYK